MEGSTSTGGCTHFQSHTPVHTEPKNNNRFGHWPLSVNFSKIANQQNSHIFI